MIDNRINNTRKEFLREILYNNIAIIAIQNSKTNFLDTFSDFSQRISLLSEIHSSPSGKFPYTYYLKLPVWGVVITIQYGKNRHTVYSFFLCVSTFQNLLYLYGDFHHTAW